MEKKTNVIFILSDDHGSWAVGCYGNGEILTPNLDRLANEGVRFENFFCTSPVCSPSRASILTGKIPSQHGVLDWIVEDKPDPFNQNGETGMIEYLADQIAYTDILASNGYVNGVCGKWHLGYAWKPQKSFSYWHVFHGGSSRYFNAMMIRDGQEEVAVDGYLSDYIADNAMRFIEDHAHSDTPFYININFNAPHTPWKNNHPKELMDLYKDCLFESCPQGQEHPWSHGGERNNRENAREDLQGYFAAVTGMDRNIGRIIDKLEQLGIRENTLIVYMGDNGFNCGHHGIWGKGNATIPINMFDTSVKVPAIFSQPNRIPKGIVSNALLSGYDVFPTLLDYLGLENPYANELPGKSFVSCLTGEQENGDERIIVFDEYGPVRMIRTHQWKYVHRYPFGPHELYDLVNDSDEKHNLFDEPTHKEVVESLRYQLNDWFACYAHPKMDGAKEEVTGRGQINYLGPKGQGKKAFLTPKHFKHSRN